jgi:nucleoside-diphosphate-sugar epimerase
MNQAAIRILVTGAAGHLGRALTRTLRREQPFGPGADVVAVDRRWSDDEPKVGTTSPPHAARLTLDLREAPALDTLASLQPDIVFHLAGITSRLAESDPALGLAVNVVATAGLLERLAARTDAGGKPPVFVQASSIGVFGTPLPPSIGDTTQPAPTLSYGTHKRMVELLLADHARRGRIDGRAVRLPSVVARPPEVSGALSSFASDLLREPTAGRPYTCPIGPQGTLWLLSTPACVDALIHAARLPGHRLPPSRCWTLPALRASAGEVVAALARRVGPEIIERVQWAPNPALTAQFAAWPALHTPLADALGFRHDSDLDRLLARALEAMEDMDASPTR